MAARWFELERDLALDAWLQDTADLLEQGVDDAEWVPREEEEKTLREKGFEYAYAYAKDGDKLALMARYVGPAHACSREVRKRIREGREVWVLRTKGRVVLL